MDARTAGLFDSNLGVRFGGAVAQTHDEVMRAWEIHHEARQRIIAFEVAAKLDYVREYRVQYLPGGLLNPDPGEISAWLTDRLPGVGSVADSAAHDTRLLVVDVDPTFSFERGSRWVPRDGAPREVPRLMNLYVRFVHPVRPNLALGELSRVGERLSVEFGWTQASATRWVIVQDAIPTTGSLRSAGNLRESAGRDANGIPWNRFAAMRIPLSFPASRLVREFEELQRLVRNTFNDVPSPRPTSPENVALVLHCIALNDGTRTWMDVLKLWNQQQTTSRFEETRKGVHLFAKTVRKTYRAIMGEQLPLVWRTTEDDAD